MTSKPKAAPAVQAARITADGTIRAAELARSGAVLNAKVAAIASVGVAAVGAFGLVLNTTVQGHYALEQAKVAISASAQAVARIGSEFIVSTELWESATPLSIEEHSVVFNCTDGTRLITSFFPNMQSQKAGFVTLMRITSSREPDLSRACMDERMESVV